MFKIIANIISKNFFSSIKPLPQITVTRDSYLSLHLHCNQLIQQQKLKSYLRQVVKEESNDNQTKAVWVYIQSQNLIHTNFLCNQFNFKIHHGVGNKIAFSKWVSPKTDLIPPYSNFYVSCGAIVINDDHILLVEQKNVLLALFLQGPRKNCFGIPGGRSDCGQTLQQTSERQLIEQTGIVAKFNYFIYCRQFLNTVFGANDIYFACVMKCQKQSLNSLKICERQLSGYQWVHLSNLQKFMKQKAFGTQYYLAKYLNELYNSGYDFNNLKQQLFPNKTMAKVLKGADKVERKFVQHQLVKIIQK